MLPQLAPETLAGNESPATLHHPDDGLFPMPRCPQVSRSSCGPSWQTSILRVSQSCHGYKKHSDKTSWVPAENRGISIKCYNNFAAEESLFSCSVTAGVVGWRDQCQFWVVLCNLNTWGKKCHLPLTKNYDNLCMCCIMMSFCPSFHFHLKRWPVSHTCNYLHIASHL